MKIRNPITGKMEDTSKAKVLPSEEVKIMKPPKKPKKKKPLKKMGGGKVMKKNMGGSLKAPNNPGLAKLPTPVRNKMGYAKAGGKVKGYKKGGPLKAESFENMKEVERGKMRKTIRNIKGTPKEIAKDKKAKKVVTAPKPKRPKSIRKTAAKAPSTKMDKERTKRIMYNKRRKNVKDYLQVRDEASAAGRRFVTEADKLAAQRKKIKNLERIKGYKKGGSITYRMSGGQVVGHGYD